MKDIMETSVYELTTISKNRYKIEMKIGVFSKEFSKKVNGCYFSGPQKAWVFPKNEISLKQFLDLYKIKSDDEIINKNNEVVHDINNKKENVKRENVQDENSDFIFFKSKIYEDYLKLLNNKKYSEPTIKTYIAHFRRFLKFYGFKHPASITNDEIRQYLIYLVKKKELSSSSQNHTINTIKFYYSNILNRKIDDFYIQRPKKKYYLPSVLSET